MRLAATQALRIASSLEKETEALVSRFTTAPTGARLILINQLIRNLKVSGVWDLLDVFWVMAAADSQAALLNWKASTSTLTATASPTFTADRGYAGDGSTSYLDTGYIPSSFGGKYALSSCHWGFWAQGSGVLSKHDMGTRNGGSNGETSIFRGASGNIWGARINQNSSGGSLTIVDGQGHYCARRLVSTTCLLDKNGGATSTSDAVNSGTLSTRSFYIGALNSAGTLTTPTTRQFGAAHIGGALVNEQLINLYRAILLYQQGVGAI